MRLMKSATLWTYKQPCGSGNMKHTMDLILVIIGVSVVIFTSIMIFLYVLTGGIPDELCRCFFGVIGGECGAMAWIRTSKERNKDREWMKEDRDYEQGKDGR